MQIDKPTVNQHSFEHFVEGLSLLKLHIVAVCEQVFRLDLVYLGLAQDAVLAANHSEEKLKDELFDWAPRLVSDFTLHVLASHWHRIRQLTALRPYREVSLQGDYTIKLAAELLEAGPREKLLRTRRVSFTLDKSQD